MIVERTEHPQWLSNAYLVAEGPGGHGFFVDGNGLTDVLVHGTVGGTAGPTGDLGELKHSILDVLLALDPDTRVFPGHREDTTIGEERRTNPFIRAWLDGEGLGGEPCRVGGQDATLLL